MIGIYSYRRDCWDSALSSSPSVRLIDSIEDAFSGDFDSVVFDLDLDAHYRKVLSMAKSGGPLRISFVGHDGSLPYLPSRLVSGDKIWLHAESYGFPFVYSTTLTTFFDKTALCDRIPLAPASTHGPGVVDALGRPVFWSTTTFDRHGDHISRDNPEVLSYLRRAWLGEVPLWVEPGIATQLPDSTVSFGDLEGVLCASDVPGGFKVLSIDDLCAVWGSPLVSSLEELQEWIPAVVCQKVLEYLDSMTPVAS